MDWLYSLFVEHSALQAVVVLSLISAIGLGLGKIHVCGISLGVTFVFFAGIIAGHFGLSIDPQMLNYAEASAGDICCMLWVCRWDRVFSALSVRRGTTEYARHGCSAYRHPADCTGQLWVGGIPAGYGGHTLRCHDKHTGTRCGTADIETDGIGVQYLLWGVRWHIRWGGRVILAVLFIRKTLAHKEDLELKEKDDVNKLTLLRSRCTILPSSTRVSRK